MPASIRCTLIYKLPWKNENDCSELFISILAHLFPINLNINCYYGIMIIEMVEKGNSQYYFFIYVVNSKYRKQVDLVIIINVNTQVWMSKLYIYIYLFMIFCLTQES
jgi:hypothetical protein